MKKNNLFIALACVGLLMTGCNKPASSSENKPASTSGNASTQSQPSSQSNNPSTSSTPAVVETFYEVPFGDANSALNGSDGKWGKGAEYSWTFNVPKNYKKVQFAVGAKMSSSSHSDRSLYTNHEGASSNDKFESDEANDGTCRITVKANGVEQTVAQTTYGEAELNTDEFTYFRVSEFAVNAGELVVTLKTNASTGYRLMLGEGARLYYNAADESATPTVVPQAEGYTVTFAATHCKVFVYEDQDYTVDPVEATSAVTRDSDGNICKYVAPDADGNGEVKPQVNFKVVPDSGYKVTDDCITIGGTAGTDYNNLKGQGNGIYRITVIKKDLTVTIAAIVDDGSQTIDAGKVTFALTNCTVKVYVGPKNEAGDNIDAGPDFYGRSKTEPYGYLKGDDAQFHFEVVPNTGFKFVDETDYGTKGEAEKANVAWADGGFNKVKLLAENYYRLTKVTGDVTLTIACVAE